MSKVCSQWPIDNTYFIQLVLVVSSLFLQHYDDTSRQLLLILLFALSVIRRPRDTTDVLTVDWWYGQHCLAHVTTEQNYKRRNWNKKNQCTIIWFGSIFCEGSPEIQVHYTLTLTLSFIIHLRLLAE